MTTIDTTPLESTQERSCEICGVRERIAGGEGESGVQVVAELEQQAQSGAQWQLCVCCQVAMSLWESGDDQDCPSA
ncbi:MAG: hypothetical protein E8D41_01330 [Nitrospira sp.]|nr:MAG: hypothetical protein E8D41_01330 [Nitrospira sp.]